MPPGAGLVYTDRTRLHHTPNSLRSTPLAWLQLLLQWMLQASYAFGAGRILLKGDNITLMQTTCAMYSLTALCHHATYLSAAA
jgi:hypothetical protein